MGLRDQFERDMEELESDYEQGLMSREEFNRAVKELEREYRWEANESAQRAYDEEMERW